MHSKTPWAVEEKATPPDHIVVEGEGLVEFIGTVDKRINARYIIRAVNSHAALKEALKNLTSTLSHYPSELVGASFSAKGCSVNHLREKAKAVQSALDAAREALKLAE